MDGTNHTLFTINMNVTTVLQAVTVKNSGLQQLTAIPDTAVDFCSQ